MTVQTPWDPGMPFLLSMASFGVFMTHALPTDKSGPGGEKEQVGLVPVPDEQMGNKTLFPRCLSSLASLILWQFEAGAFHWSPK